MTRDGIATLGPRRARLWLTVICIPCVAVLGGVFAPYFLAHPNHDASTGYVVLIACGLLVLGYPWAVRHARVYLEADATELRLLTPPPVRFWGRPVRQDAVARADIAALDLRSEDRDGRGEASITITAYDAAGTPRSEWRTYRVFGRAELQRFATAAGLPLAADRPAHAGERSDAERR